MREESPGHDETQRQPDPLSGEKHFWSSHASVILVPLDGSEEAKTGLVAARFMARILGVSIHVVHASAETLSQADLLQRT
ncbi:MAG: universal stress protein, partial [Dehalococcoidia bacterium]|nr:universal stress protein [Dehalococcoidia bacterium]